MRRLGRAGSCGGRGGGLAGQRREEEEEEDGDEDDDDGEHWRREKSGGIFDACCSDKTRCRRQRGRSLLRAPGGARRERRAQLSSLLFCASLIQGRPFRRQASEQVRKKERKEKVFTFFLSVVLVVLLVSRTKKKKKKKTHHSLSHLSYLSWDDYFMALAFLSAQRSKDPNKQVGACIVSPDRIILGIGYNGFPRGCADSKLPWAKKAASGGALATKYPYVCHAEMNAVLNKNAASVAGATLYVTMFPCNECSKLLIQAGIGEVVYYEDKLQQANSNADGGNGNGNGRPSSPFAAGGILPAESYAASRTLLALARVRTRQHAPAEALVLRVAPLDEAAAGKEKRKGGGVLRDTALKAA